MYAWSLLTLILAASHLTYSQERKAIAVITVGEVKGSVIFTQTADDEVTVTGSLEGLKPGLHGFHVHEKADLTSGCTSTGGHYNPLKKHHGGPLDAERHVGDLGNIEADGNGIANFTLVDRVISLRSGPFCIMGRAVVVHSDADDLGKGGFTDSLTTGHAGSRVGCGIIGILNDPTDYTVHSTAATLISSFALLISSLVVVKVTEKF